MSDQPTSCEHGMPLHIGCDDCTISRMHSRIEADEALMREMRENVIWAFGELNGIDVADDNNCMKATLAALGKIDTALRKRLESSK